MIWCHFARSTANELLVVPSIASNARWLSITSPAEGEALQPFCGADIKTSTLQAFMSTQIVTIAPETTHRAAGKRASKAAHLLHSVDSLRLAQKISRAAVDDERVVHVLAQVNTSGEESKSGFTPESVSDDLPAMAELPGLSVDGLMTMAPFVDDEVVLGDAFARLRRLSEELRGGGIDVGPELSMGMTNDLEIAIREGSTMVRIGTALFGQRGTT